MGKYDYIVGEQLEDGYCSWDSDRALLYAVGVGAGLQNNLEELEFTTENTPNVPQKVLPTFLVLMNSGKSDWIPRLNFGEGGNAPIGMVHGEQSVNLVRSIPPQGRARVTRKLIDVYDKIKGALVITESRVELEDGELLGTARMGLFVQGRGGFGGPRTPPDELPWTRPEREPDKVESLPVGMNQSLIYRLLGDRTLHGTDPVRAKADGFPRPVLFGLGTFGIAGRAILRGVCDADESRFGKFEGRFSKPVHPGDRLDTLIWHTEDGAQFQVLANGERIVIDRGVFKFRQ